MSERARKLLVVINTSWNIINFRTGLIRGLMGAGYEVVVAAPRDRFSAEIERNLGCRYVELPIAGHSRSPVTDLALFGRFVSLMRAERPDAFLGFTVKPNVFGSLAANLFGIPCINNIAGLGSVFNETSLTARIVVILYRIALRRSHWVFFQNREDLELFVARGLVQRVRAGLLPGSGIDTARFATPAKVPSKAGQPFTFLLVARLLKEKGLAELAEATRAVRRKHPQVRTRVLGPLDPRNPAAVPQTQLDGWVAEGVLEYLGVADDVRTILAQADCFVLPSYYREGTPRALLEAAAMAKPIITTDMPGCRDVVDEGMNGCLVPPRDVCALADAMTSMIEASPATIAAMGQASRVKAEQQFDEKLVVERYLAALLEILLTPQRGRSGRESTMPHGSRN